MASIYSSESKFMVELTVTVIERLQFMWNMQLHHRAAVLLPHLDRDALQQEERLCLPWWSRPGGVQVFFVAWRNSQLFGAIPRTPSTNMQIAEILYTGVSQPVWSQNQHSNPALLVHRVWHVHTGSHQIDMILRKARKVNDDYLRKQKRPTVTTEGGETWTTWTQSCKMSRGSWSR